MFTIRRHTGILFVSALLVVTLRGNTAIPMPVPERQSCAGDHDEGCRGYDVPAGNQQLQGDFLQR